MLRNVYSAKREPSRPSRLPSASPGPPSPLSPNVSEGTDQTLAVLLLKSPPLPRCHRSVRIDRPSLYQKGRDRFRDIRASRSHRGKHKSVSTAGEADKNVPDGSLEIDPSGRLPLGGFRMPCLGFRKPRLVTGGRLYALAGLAASDDYSRIMSSTVLPPGIIGRTCSW